jgi:hypothetical protein
VDIVLRAKSPKRSTGRVRVQEAAIVSTHVTLADATDIAAWADRQDARTLLPRLIRRLILSSDKRVVHATFRADEGTDLAGWDGFTVSESADAHVPAGGAGWELSVRKDITTKASEDYDQRTKDPGGVDPSQTTFIFVTARRWRDKSSWAQARSKERHWRTVMALDADDLDAWLELTPGVHVWFSRLIGKRPDDVVDLETVWADWSQATRPALNAKFLLAGRAKAAEEIQQALQEGRPTFSIRAESQEEALAVLCAAIDSASELDRSAWLSRVVVARTPAAWERLVASRAPLILVPLFDSVELAARGVRTGHQVVALAGVNQPQTPTSIDVPRLSVGNAVQALVDCGVPKDTAEELALLGRRSLTALRRKMSIRPELQQPQWASPSNTSAVLPFVLAGSWNESSSGDLDVLSSMAQMESRRILELARRLAREADAPMRATGNVWYLASKEDSWQLLAPALTRPDLERFKEAVLSVLGTPDPRLEVPADKRWFSTERPPHSGALRRGLAETLAVMGARGTAVVAGTPISRWAELIVRELLERANKNWRLWASLSRDLALLAEGAPEAFLAAVEEGLQGVGPLLKLFDEQQGDPLFSSPSHTGLLWALERLAWSDEHLARAALALAKLTRLDPGGKWANRPRTSLRETFLLWHPQTSASWMQRMQILRMLIEREPEVGWQLHASLLPRFHDSSSSRTKPQWRDWAPERETAPTVGDHIAHITELVSQMLTLTGNRGERWKDLVAGLPDLPRDVHDTVVSRLEAVNPDDFTEEDRSLVWNALRDVVGHHRSFPTAQWALPKQRVDKLDSLLSRFQPQDTFSRFGWLFANHVHLPTGRQQDWHEEEKAVAEARRNAVEAIFRLSGMSALEDLAGRVEHPHYLGGAFGASGLGEESEENGTLRSHLASDDSAFNQFARGFVVGRLGAFGENWIDEKFRLKSLTARQRAELLILLPNGERAWELARSEHAVEEAYWKNAYPHFRGSAEDVAYAATQLVKHGRAFAASELVAFHLKDPSPPSSELIVSVLEGMLHQGEPDAVSSGLSYWIGELLDSLSSNDDIEEARVAKIEWAFASALSHDRPPKVLHRELSRNPLFFVELLTLVYRREDEERREASETDRLRATTAYNVLDSWTSIPGALPNGVIDQGTLDSWVDAVLTKGTAEGRSAIASQHVGKVLSHSPQGTDGVWPHAAVRSVLERLEDRELERGLEIGVFNKRGVVTRSLQEGGRQEQLLADQYGSWAAATRDRWPRTADVLRRLEETYRDMARREDLETELRQDGVW